MRLHLTGASGTGTTTLGLVLGRRLRIPAVDTDDFYWLPTDPPFTDSRSIEERLSLLREALGAGGWILSGSLVGWGDPLIALFDAVVFLVVPRQERLRRLSQREQNRYGPRIAPGGSMFEQHLAFMAWAGAYEDGSLEIRSRALHEQWLSTLPCPVIRIEGMDPTERHVALVGNAVERLSIPATERSEFRD